MIFNPKLYKVPVLTISVTLKEMSDWNCPNTLLSYILPYQGFVLWAHFHEMFKKDTLTIYTLFYHGTLHP